MTDYQQQVQQAIVTVAEKEKPEPFITLSTGVILKVKKINYMIVQAVINQFKYPDIPEVFDKDRGRPIRNPDNPDYKKLCAEVDAHRMNAVADAIAAFGVDIHHIPDHITPIEDETWIKELALVHIHVEKDFPAARQQAWINYVALKEADDIATLTKQFLSVMGVSEAAVAESIRDNFPR